MSRTFTHLNFDSLDFNPNQSAMTNAMALVRRGAVIGLTEDERRISAKVQEYGWAHQVNILLSEDGFAADLMCDCGYQTSRQPCVHMLAVLLSGSPFAGDEDDLLSVLINQEIPVEKVQPVLWLTPSAKAIEADYRKRLDTLTVKQLRELAARRGIALKGLRRDVIFETVIQSLVRPEALEAVLRGLHPETRSVLELVKLFGLETSLYSATLSQALPYLQAALQPFKPQRRVASCLEDLTQLALLVADGSENLHVPLQVQAHPSIHPGLFVEYQGKVETIEESTPFQFSRLAMLLALSGQAGDLPLNPPVKTRDYTGWPKSTSDPYVSVAEIKPEGALVKETSLGDLAASLSEPAEKVDFCARSMLAADFWLERDPRRLSKSFTNWLQRSPAEQSRDMLHSVVIQPTTFELDAARSAGSFTMKRNTNALDYDSFMVGLTTDRLRLLRLLASAPAGVWLDLEALLRLLHGLTPYWLLEFTSRAPAEGRGNGRLVMSTFIERQDRKIDILDFDAWSKTFGLFYVKAITQTFFWLGLLDLAWAGKRPIACRLTQFGEYLLERTADYHPEKTTQKQPAIQVDSDLSIRLNLETATAELINLLLLSGRQRGGKMATRSGKPAFTYEITLQGLGRAFEAGWDQEQVQSVLAGAYQQPLPTPLTAFLRSAWENYGRLYLYTDIALIEFADDYCLPELLANSSLNQILLYTFSPRVVAVRPDGLQNLVGELRARGYTPQVEGETRG